MFGALAMLIVGGARAACDAVELAASLDATEAAFAQGDRVAAHLATVRTRDSLGCLKQPLAPATVARIHRATALARSLQHDDRGVHRALRGMLHADPRMTLPAELVPGDHPLRAAEQAAEEALPAWSPSLRRVALIDGVLTGAVPVDQHYVVQELDGLTVTRGELVQRTSMPRRVRMGFVERNHAAPPARTLWHTGLGLGIGGLALLGTAGGTRAAYDVAVRQGELGAGLRTTSTATAIGGVSALALSTVSITVSEILRARR